MDANVGDAAHLEDAEGVDGCFVDGLVAVGGADPNELEGRGETTQDDCHCIVVTCFPLSGTRNEEKEELEESTWVTVEPELCPLHVAVWTDGRRHRRGQKEKRR